MGTELTVYQQMVADDTRMLCEVLKREIGIKMTSLPFAIRATDHAPFKSHAQANYRH